MFENIWQLFSSKHQTRYYFESAVCNDRIRTESWITIRLLVIYSYHSFNHNSIGNLINLFRFSALGCGDLSWSFEIFIQDRRG